MGREPDITSVAAPTTRPAVPRARIRPCRLPTRSPVMAVERRESGCVSWGWTCIAISVRSRSAKTGACGRAAACRRARKACGCWPIALGPRITSRWRRRATRWRSRGRWSRTLGASSWRHATNCERSARPRSRPTAATRARSRGCWPPGCCMAAGCRMSRRGRCVGVWRAGRSWCASAPARRTRSTPC
jgi:hypothetical protein